MRLLELFLDTIGQTTLFEMARSRKDAKDLVTNLSPTIVKHLVKLFVFSSPENKNHWINETDNWLNQIDDIYLKPQNKKPEWKTVYNWMIFDSSPHYSAQYIDGLVNKWVKTNYSNVQVYDYDSELVLNQILNIIQQVCKDIQNHKFISIRDYLDYKNTQ